MREFDQTFTNAASEFRIVPLNTIESGTTVTSENVAEAVHDGPFVTPGGTVPPTGNVLGGKYVGVFEVRDGKIAAQRLYYDSLLVARQLGLLPDG
jgi:ketosteroid isomerase-like protein